MALLPIYYSTTRYGNRKKKRMTRSYIESKRKTEELLKRVGYVKKKIQPQKARVEERYTGEYDVAPLSNSIPGGTVPKANEKHYSGEQKLLGVATLHKSNMVPVFSKKDAEDISKMRRG